MLRQQRAQFAMDGEKQWDGWKMEFRYYWEIKTELNRGNAWIYRSFLRGLSCGVKGKALN